MFICESVPLFEMAERQCDAAPQVNSKSLMILWKESELAGVDPGLSEQLLKRNVCYKHW